MYCMYIRTYVGGHYTSLYCGVDDPLHVQGALGVLCTRALDE